MDDRALGLSGDPTAPQRPEASKEGSDKPLTGEYPPFDPLKTQIPLLVPKDPSREQIIPRKSGPPRKKLFILSAAVIIALCVVGLFFMTHKPSSEGLTAITGENTSNDSDLPRGPLDNQEKIPSTTEKLNFKEDETSHFIRTNLTSGKLLIITGRITNGYHDRRSFIRVRGVLKNPDGVVEAERQSYAGNYLSETELTSLPINEILSRLAIKGGQNGLNVNLEPGQSISFMLVFDKIPEDLVNYEYVVDVVSSTPSGPPTGNAQPQPQSPGSETS
jgi:hypothetical protein